MKVLFIQPNLSRYAYKQIYALSQLNDIEIYLLYKKSDVSVQNANILERKCRGICKNLPILRYPYQYKVFIKKLQKFIDEWKIDLINAYSMPDDLVVASIETRSVPVVYCVRDLTSTLSPQLLASRIFPKKIIYTKLIGNIPSYIVYKYILSIEKKSMERSDARIFSTSCMLDYAKHRYKISDNNLVFLNYILKEEIPSLNMEKLSNKIEGIHIGFAGNITVSDRYRNFLPFFIELAKKKIHVHMHVVSRDKNSLRVCKKTAEKNEYLHFYPPMPPKKVIKYLSAYDFGILPFETELEYYETILPNKLFDYIAAGIPIISSDVRCIKNFISKHNIGFYYKDFKDLIEKLKYTDPTKFKIERAKFLIDKHIDKLLDFYKKII